MSGATNSESRDDLREHVTHSVDQRSAGAEETVDPLSAIAQRTSTDKWWMHNYTSIYHRHFGALRYGEITLLELGVGGEENPGIGGHSLRMWKEYFPHGRIIGIDIYDKSELAEERIVIERGSQADPDFVAGLSAKYGPFDIVIDDGSHLSDHVVASLNLLWPALKEGGTYAIEDIQCAYLPSYNGGRHLDDPALSINVLKQLIDSVNADTAVEETKADQFTRAISGLHFYPNLVIVEKGQVPRRNALFGGTEAQFLKSLAEVEQELYRSPSSAGLTYTRSVLLCRLKQHAEALAPAHRAVKLQPDNPEYWHHLGNLQLLLRRVPASIASQREAIRLSPANPHFHAALGRSLARAGELEEALTAFRKAQELKPDSTQFQSHIADVQSRLGKLA